MKTFAAILLWTAVSVIPIHFVLWVARWIFERNMAGFRSNGYWEAIHNDTRQAVGRVESELRELHGKLDAMDEKINRKA